MRDPSQCSEAPVTSQGNNADPFLMVDGVATRLAIRQLKRAKINPEPLLAKSGISYPKSAAEPKRISGEGQLRFLEVVSEALGDSAFCFRLAQLADVRELGVLYYVMAASQDLRDALLNLVRYLRVVNESVRVVLSEKADGAVLTVHRKVAGKNDRHFIEFGSALLLHVSRKITEQRLRPKVVTFTHGRNADIAEFDRFFECPVQFGADANTIVLPIAMLSTSIPSSDNYLLVILKEHCESILAERGKPSSALRAMVENEIAALLPAGKARSEKWKAKITPTRRSTRPKDDRYDGWSSSETRTTHRASWRSVRHRFLFRPSSRLV